jgi:hypothetical protein
VAMPTSLHRLKRSFSRTRASSTVTAG